MMAELQPDAIVITAIGIQSSLGGAVSACAGARAKPAPYRYLIT